MLLVLRKVCYVNKLCTYNKVLPSIYDISFLKFIRALCLCEHVVLNMSHFLPHNCSESLFPRGNMVCLHPIPSLHRALPPCALMRSPGTCLELCREGDGRRRGCQIDAPWSGFELFCHGRKFHERTVNSSHFIHALMNVDVCAFQFCDCFSLYFHYFGVSPDINIFSFPKFIVVTGFLNQLFSSLRFF